MKFLYLIFVALMGTALFTLAMADARLELADLSRRISELTETQQLIKSNVADQKADITEVKVLIAIQNTEIERQNVRITEQNGAIEQQNGKITEVGFATKTLIAEQNIEIQKQNVKIAELKCCPESNCPNRCELINENSQHIQQQEEYLTQLNQTVEKLKKALDKMTNENRQQCPTEFERHGNSCYKVLGLLASWIEAKAYCKMLGSDLAVINSEEEQNTVNGILRSFHGKLSSEAYWIDGSDMLKEGDWRWMNKNGNSELMNGYTHWSSNQPDNGGNIEHCLQIRYDYGLKWNDAPCNLQISLICESSIEEGT